MQLKVTALFRHGMSSTNRLSNQGTVGSALKTDMKRRVGHQSRSHHVSCRPSSMATCLVVTQESSEQSQYSSHGRSWVAYAILKAAAKIR